MEYNIFSQKILDAFKENSLDHLLTDESLSKLCEFADLLVETNKKFNLTAIKDENGIILKHFVDCASISKYIPAKASLIDVGCGAGFPSLPIAILRKDVKVAAIDSTQKKIDFIKLASSKLDIKNIDPKCARAEDLIKEMRESFDIVTSRAVARLNILSELCVPFLKIGGNFIAMKSSKGEEEYIESKKGIGILGASLQKTENVSFSYIDDTIDRQIFIFKKEKATPHEYPRNYSQISKKPL